MIPEISFSGIFYSTEETEALRKLKINPLKNSHCLKCETNVQSKNKSCYRTSFGEF